MTAISNEYYTPPGVYISEQSNPISVAAGLPPGRLTLIGRGQGPQTATEQVPLGTDGYRLSVKGIIAETVTVTVVSDDSTLDPTNYTLTQEVVSGADHDHYYRIARTSESSAPEGTAVWVTYNYMPLGYGTPRVYTSPADVSSVYGAAMTVGGDPGSAGYNPVNSPLTLAAEIAFANGASEIMIVPIGVEATADSADVKAALLAAYQKIETDYTATIVVPLTDGLDASDAVSAAADLKGHVSSTATAGYFRVGIYGLPLTYTGTPSDVIQSGGVASPRIVMAYASPDGMLYRNNINGSRVTLGNQYLAAAYGGIMASNPIQQSLTRRPVTGFMDLGSVLTRVQMDTYAAAGVALVEKDRVGRLIVRHGTSTDRSDMARSEPSVTRARDTMVTMIQNALDTSSIIGSPMDENSAISVKSVVAGVLEYVQSNGVIVDYHSLQARVQSLNPSVIEVRFSYKPSFPLNYVMVTFAIDLSTGDNDMSDFAGGDFTL